MTTDTEETCQTALNIARNLEWPVFPCSASKRPARSKDDGGNGYGDASTDPAEIAALWRQWPGPLIGIPTGALSGIDVLDLDAKHDIALKWLVAAGKSIPPTRTYQTRSGGCHLYFRHSEGIGNTQSKLAKGVDTRGDGGYVIFWYGVGHLCTDEAPPAPWPTWLRDCVLWQPSPNSNPIPISSRHADKAIDGILDVVRSAAEGRRNALLFWAACRMSERIGAKAIGPSEATTLLIDASKAAGLTETEARRTVASGLMVRAA